MTFYHGLREFWRTDGGVILQVLATQPIIPNGAVGSLAEHPPLGPPCQHAIAGALEQKREMSDLPNDRAYIEVTEAITWIASASAPMLLPCFDRRCWAAKSKTAGTDGVSIICKPTWNMSSKELNSTKPNMDPPMSGNCAWSI